jgi:ketosteroid isomerase-like protein
MSAENVEIVRRGYEYFGSERDFRPGIIHPEFVWDMSTFRGWPEQKTYSGLEGARSFIADWTESWDDWELDVQELLDAGDRVVAIVKQQARSKATGLTVEMDFAQVWTLRDGKQIRMEMYADPDEGRRTAGLDD